jgi:hypothetical protein
VQLIILPIHAASIDIQLRDNIKMGRRATGWWWYVLDLSGSGWVSEKSSCEHDNESLCSINC